MTDDLLLRPAFELARLLRKREISCAELLAKLLKRIERENPALNAVVFMDQEAAKHQATEADKNLQSGTARPLEGLVITIKDSIDVAGLPTTSGSPAFKDRIIKQDAPAIARLRQAGVVFLGKTNVPLMTGDFQSFNSLFGTTNHPLRQDLSPGGSSGGAAAAVASGMSTFEIGSDFAGSIRWPAHACGLFGHRPSYGLVSTRGHVPPPPGSTFEAQFSTLGPLARSADDLSMIFEHLYGPADPAAPRSPLERSVLDDPAKLRIALWADDALAPVDHTVSAAVHAAAHLLRQAGAAVDENARPHFSFAEQLDTFSLFNHAIIYTTLPEEVRLRIAQNANTFAQDDRSHQALQARGARPDAELWGKLQHKTTQFIKAWKEFFQNYDVLLCPPAPVPAIPHDHRKSFHARTLTVNQTERPYLDFLYWSSLASLSGLPASVAPISRTSEGLPLGVQIISAPGKDLTTIGVAALLEKLVARDQQETRG